MGFGPSAGIPILDRHLINVWCVSGSMHWARCPDVAPQGIGRALAERFLEAGDNVVVCSRSTGAVDAAVQELGARWAVGSNALREADV